MTNLCLFDLDDTLLPIDSDHAWGEFVVRLGWVDAAGFKRRNDTFYAQYQAGTLDIHEYVAFATEPLRTRSAAETGAAHAQFMREVITPALHPAALALVREHQARGDRIALVTATNDFVASLDFSLSEPLAGKSISSTSNLSYLLISLFVAPPPAAGAFLVGFTARRASWLGGLIYGIVAFACYAAILLSPSGKLLTGNNDPGVYIVNAALLGPIGALLFASAAAWYKRFLNLANPNRGRRPVKPDSRQKGRPGAAKAGGRAR